MLRRATFTHKIASFFAKGLTLAISPLVRFSMRLDAWADDLGWRVGRDDA